MTVKELADKIQPDPRKQNFYYRERDVTGESDYWYYTPQQYITLLFLAASKPRLQMNDTLSGFRVCGEQRLLLEEDGRIALVEMREHKTYITTEEIIHRGDHRAVMVDKDEQF